MIKMLSNDWISLTIISIFVLITVNKLLSPKRFKQLVTGIFGNKYFSFYLKDSPLISSNFNILFFPVNLLTVSLVIFYLLKHFFTDIISVYDFNVFVYINIIVFIFSVIKVIQNFIINVILSTTKKVRQFSFFKLSFRNFSSLLLLPFLLVHQYSSIDKGLSITVLLSVFIAISVIQYAYSSYLIIQQKQYSILYIILYLCALEITPTIIYLKLVFIVFEGNFLSF